MIQKQLFFRCPVPEERREQKRAALADKRGEAYKPIPPCLSKGAIDKAIRNKQKEEEARRIRTRIILTTRKTPCVMLAQ